MRTCRVRVEEKEEFLVYTVLWTLTCHPYLENATALSDALSDISRAPVDMTRERLASLANNNDTTSLPQINHNTHYNDYSLDSFVS